MSTLDVEAVDLEELASVIERSGGVFEGAIAGRSSVRDVVAAHLDCSMLEAETLVDTLVGRGFLRLVRDDDGRQIWRRAHGS
jgi:hypothetical protein